MGGFKQCPYMDGAQLQSCSVMISVDDLSTDSQRYYAASASQNSIMSSWNIELNFFRKKKTYSDSFSTSKVTIISGIMEQTHFSLFFPAKYN